MRDKEIKKLIKAKANLVIIPDVKDKIKARFDEVPPQSIKQRTYGSRRLMTAMASTFILFVAIMIGLLYQVPDTDPLITGDVDDDAVYEVVMLSSVSTISIIDQSSLDGVIADSVTLLSGGPMNDHTNDEEEIVTNNFTGLRRYLHIMENLLSSDGVYPYQKEVINRRQQKYALKFAVKSLDDIDINYEVIYEVIENTDEQIKLQMTMQKNNASYTSQVVYQKQSQAMTTTALLSDGQTLAIDYTSVDGQSTYQLTRSLGGSVVEQVVISYQTKDMVSLTFEQGDVEGEYTFRMIQGLNRRILSIDYHISDTYYGNMLVSINGANANKYSVVVRPENGQSFLIRNAGRFN